MAYPGRKMLKEYCEENGVSQMSIARKFKMSMTFLNMVLKFHRPCPHHTMLKLAKLFDEDPEKIGLMFGFYPNDWTRLVRKHPDKILGIMRDLLVEEGFRKEETKTKRKQARVAREL